MSPASTARRRQALARIGPSCCAIGGDLQPGEVVVAEKIDRISRLPLAEAERLVASIRAKGARLAVPGVVDLSDLAAEAQGGQGRARGGAGSVAQARPAGRARRLRRPARAPTQAWSSLSEPENTTAGVRTRRCTSASSRCAAAGGRSQTASLAGCNESQVKRVWAKYQQRLADQQRTPKPQRLPARPRHEAHSRSRPGRTICLRHRKLAREG